MKQNAWGDAAVELFDKAKTKFNQAEVFSLEMTSTSASFRNGKLKETSDEQNQGLCLRIIHEGRIAQSSTSNFSKLDEVIRQAGELVRFGEQALFDFPASRASTGMKPAGNDIGLDQMVETGKQIVDIIGSFDSSVLSHAGSSVTQSAIHLLNTAGLDVSFARTSHHTYAAGLLTEGRNILMTYSIYMGQNKTDDISYLADRVVRMIQIARKNTPFSSQKIPVLLSPMALADLFAAFSPGVTGTLVAKGISPLIGKTGEMILHPDVSIEDDPTYPDAVLSQPFDDEGIASQKKYIINRGVLENFILDLKSAAKLSLPPNGNGYRYTPLIQSRSYVVAPAPNFTNLIVSSGRKHHLDIIRETPRLIYIDQLTGILLGNLINGDWSANIEYGVLFEKGEPVGRIKNAMTGGNFYQLFRDNYVESSGDRQWVSSFGGGAGACLMPHILFDGLNISAKSSD